jgi:hypothetical protein
VQVQVELQDELHTTALRTAEAKEGKGDVPVAATAESPTDQAELLTPELTEAFMARWTEEVLAEEKRLADAGKRTGLDFPDTEGKFDSWLHYLPRVLVADLRTICLTARGEVSLSEWSVDVRSSKKEVRSLLAHAAYNELVKRDPFLALTLPQNDPAKENEKHYTRALSQCARIDAEKTWRVVQEKYGGTGGSPGMLVGILTGAAGEDVTAKLDLARKWSVLDRVAGQWTVNASRKPAWQDAWLAAMHEAPPVNAEAQYAKFAGEVETSDGFAGVQRIIDQIANPHTPLYDLVLQQAATRDLEELAGAKADWILARVSPAISAATAESLMKHWTETDPLSASEWLNAVPKTAPWRSSAVLAFAKVIEPHDPEAASQWRNALGKTQD